MAHDPGNLTQLSGHFRGVGQATREVQVEQVIAVVGDEGFLPAAAQLGPAT